MFSWEMETGLVVALQTASARSWLALKPKQSNEQGDGFKAMQSSQWRRTNFKVFLVALQR